MIRQWINSMRRATNHQEEETDEEETDYDIPYTPLLPQAIEKRQESLLAEAEVTSHNFGQKALEALYDNNEDSRYLVEAIIEKYVLPLQEKE